VNRIGIRKACASVALLALVANSAWPLISPHFSYGGRADPVAEICSTTHAKQPSGPALPSKHHHSTDCALCSLAVDKPLAPARDIPLLVVSQREADFCPATDLAAPPVSLACPPAPPRAPPLPS
jgi:hypothetical protein